MAASRNAKFIRVALVLPTEFAYARGVLQGIITATRERNRYPSGESSRQALPWSFRVYRGIYGHSTKYLAKWFRDWEPDGVICQIYDDRLAKVYSDLNKPVIELFTSRSDSQFPLIVPDDVAAGEMAARHFLERGFRHFAFFGAPWMLWSRERELGFRNEIERAFQDKAQSHDPSKTPPQFTFSSYGALPNKSNAFEVSHNRPAAAMATWLASLPKPLALFVANDLWGFEMLQTARELGMHVPDDVAALGVDNEELLCEIAHPPLSSIKIGAEQIGHAAVAMLEQLLAGKSVSKTPLRIPPLEVVNRQSTDVLAVEDADVAAALRHIRLHAVEGLSVKQMLDSIAVNRRTLERRFISVLGHTPLDEIRRVRLERAKDLLRTDLPVYEVAVKSGYATPEYLATSFLRATGLSPTAYRRQFTPRIALLPPQQP